MSDLFKQALQAQLANNLTSALTLYKKVLIIEPLHADSLFNAGLICVQTNDFNQAISFLEKAALIKKNAAICSLLGLSYMNTEQAQKAIQYYHEAIIFDPQEYMAHNHLGILYCQNHEYYKGIKHLKEAIKINPDEYSALSDLGMALMQQGEYQQAADYFKLAISASHYQSTIAYQNLLLCLCFDESAFPKKYLEEAKNLDQLFLSSAKPFTNWPQTHKNSNQPLKIGLVCGDINNHPVGYFLESFIRHIDSKTLVFFVYNTSHYEDDLTLRIKPFIKKWTNIHQYLDQQSAQIIHHDGVDILIDLAGHTAYNRLSIFAFKPAPIQISFLGYFASTGMSFIDYFLTDKISVPSEYTHHFSEKIAYLNHSRLCFTPPASQFNQSVNDLPALAKGYVNFGCFQNLSKINLKTLKLWKEIINHNPKNKLTILNQQFNDETIKHEFLKKILNIGIPAEQLVLKGGSSRINYFKAYNDIDFMLDTFPYPGGTTTCEALWMGVPTLTLTGKTLLERQGQTIMTNADLDDWICFSENEYIDKAIKWSKNTQKLANIRATLRSKLQKMPIMNAEIFASDFEQILLDIWEKNKIKY